MKDDPAPATSPKGERRTSLKKGAFLNWTSLTINFAVSFVLTPVIIRQLGATGFGMWSLIQSFAGYYGLVNLGLASALQRFISRDLAKREFASLQATIGTTIAFFAVSGIVVLVAAALLGQPAAGFFEISAEDVPLFRSTVLLCAIAVVADFFGALLGTMYTARERFDLSNLLGIGRQLAQAAGIVAILRVAPTIHSLALVVGSVAVLSLLVNWQIAGGLYPEVTLNFRKRSVSRLKELLHYGTSTVLITISNIIRLRLGNIVIAKTTSLQAVGVFSVAANLIVSMNGIMSATLNVLNPRFTRLHTQNNTAELKHTFRMSLFASATMACAMGLTMIVFGKRFIHLWVGPQFLPAAPILSALAIAYTVSHAQAPGWNLMFALAKHHFMARVTIAEAIVVVALGLWWSQTHGALGFAWATAAAMLATKVFLQPAYTARIAGLTLGQYLSPMAIPFVVSIALLLATRLLSLEQFLDEHGLIVLIAVAGTTLAAYAIAILLASRRRDYFPASMSRLLARVGLGHAGG